MLPLVPVKASFQMQYVNPFQGVYATGSHGEAAFISA